MKKITIEFNPIEKEVLIKHDNIEWNKNDNKYFSGYDFESALTGIIEVILNEICIDGDNELEIEFIGRKIEYLILKDALNKVSKVKINNIKHRVKYDISVTEIIKKIEKLDEKFFKRKQELLTKLKSNPEVFVIGNYGTGKSTFLNAVLRNDILYVDIDVATNKLFYIVNDEKEQLFVLDGKKWKKESFKNVDELKEKIYQINKSNKASKIKLHYPLESFKGMQLQFVDTPGVNNAIDEEHRRLAFDAINDEVNYPLVLIFVDAQNYKSTDYSNFFNKIKQRLKSDPRNLERFIFIVNKADFAEDIKKFSEEVKEYLFDLFENNKLKIFFTDSLLAQALYKKEKGKELSRKERRKIRDLEDDIEYGEEIFFPEYSTVYELFNVDRDNLVEYSGVPFVEKYIKNYLINSFEKEKIEDVLNELNRVEEEYKEKIKEITREIEVKQKEIKNLKNKLLNKDFNSIFKELENEIKKEEKDLKNLEVKIKKFQEGLEKLKKKIDNISIDKRTINGIYNQWTEEINYIQKIDIIERLNSLSIKNFTENNIKKVMKDLFKTTSDFKCSEFDKEKLFYKLNHAANDQLQIFEDRFSFFKKNFENIKNAPENTFWKQLYNLFKIEKNEAKKEEIKKFINSAINALEDELKTIQKIKQKPIRKEGVFSKGLYCQVDVLIDKIEYMIEKDKGIYKYYYLLKRLPELSIELASEFEAQFKKNILQEVENIKKEMSKLIEDSDFNKLEKINLQTINLKGFDKFRNIFLNRRDSLEETKNTIFNIDLTPGREWISHTAKYLNEKEVRQINIEFRKEFASLQNNVNQEIVKIKDSIKNNIHALEKEISSLQQKQQAKIEKLKDIKKEYDKTKNEQQQEQKIKKEIVNINKEIENLQKTIKKYESFLKQLKFKDAL